MKNKHFQIVDLDGCISDDLWRRRLITPLRAGEPNYAERFHEYHRHAHLDVPRNLHELAEDAEVIVLTARPLTYRDITLNWLLEVAALPHAHLIMRNPHDHRPSVDVKADQLRWLFDPNMEYGVTPKRVVQAIDDRQDIVDMYTMAGLAARVVRIGDAEGA